MLPSALRAQGYQIADGLPYHASSVYYVTLKNAVGENINSQFSAVEGAIGAFVGNELRGVSQWQATGKKAGEGVFVIRVWGSKDDEATATFRLRDDKGLEYQIASHDFSQDQEGTYGTPSAPVAFTLNTVTGISLPFTDITLKMGETRSIQPTLVPADHSPLLTTLKYTYSSDNAAITVSENGMITADAVGQGKVTVKVTPGNFTAQATVKVEKAPDKINVTEIKNNMASDKIEMEVGDQLLLDFSVLPENATNKAVKFTNNYEVIDIKQETETSPVTIIAKKEGQSVLTVISDDNEQITLTYNITVKKKVISVTKIEVNPTAIAAYVGESYSFTLSVLPDNATNKEVEASVGNTSIVDLDMDNKKITAKAVGTTKVVFRSKDGSNVEATLNVTVSAVPVVNLSFASQELTASKLRDNVLTLTKEETADFLPSRVELVFSKATNGEPAATATMADNTGLKWNVRGQYVGKHTVKIKYNGKEQAATCNVNIPAEYVLEKGWGWMSLYAAQGGSIALKNNGKWISLQIDANNKVEEIRSQHALLYNDPELGFFGDIESLTPSDGMYKVYCQYAQSVSNRMVLNAGYNNLKYAASMQLPAVRKGYTWVTYPHEIDHSLSALSTYLVKGAVSGDLIIGRDFFAEYDGKEWVAPDAFHFEAGKGYIYYTNSEAQHTINWGPATLGSDPAEARRIETTQAGQSDENAKTSVWEYNPYLYPECMAIVARLEGISDPENYSVGAFVGDECRGKGEAASNGLMYIAVSGERGDRVSFRLYYKPAERVLNIEGTGISFTGRAGSHSNPVVLRPDITAIDDVMCSRDLNNGSVYDLQGRPVNATSNCGPSSFRKGIYLKTVTEGGHRVTRKIISK